MELKNLIYDILIEEFQNKKLLNLMYEKWKTEEPQLTIEDCEKILELFFIEKDRLSPKRPQVFAFLSRFDGNHGYNKFDPANLKDIQKYSYTQIKSLYDEYQFDADEDLDDNNVFSRRSNSTEEKRREESEKLWKSDQNKVFGDDTFRVYFMPDQGTAIKYGYYQKSLSNATQWCVTWDNRSNYWERYRSEGRTFYFVIDDTKPKDDQYHISALQTQDPTNNNGYPFKITSLRNNGDQNKTKEEILEIYPKLREYISELDRVEYNRENELEYDDIVARVNEREGDKYEFRRVERKLKKRFITGTNGVNGGNITKEVSWMSMDNDLRRLYITLLTKGTIFDRLQNYRILALIDSQSDTRSLLRERIDQIRSEDPTAGEDFGIAMLYKHLIKNDFVEEFKSKQNKNIRIFKNRSEPKFGIYNLDGGFWLKQEGVTYSPDYSEMDYMYGSFRKTNSEQPKDEPIDDQNTDTETTNTEVEESSRTFANDARKPANHGMKFKAGRKEINESTELNEQGEFKMYLIHVYSKTNSLEDSSNFYMIVDPETDSGEGSFVTHKTWTNKFKPLFDIVDDIDFEKEYDDVGGQLTSYLNEKGGV